MRIASNKLYDMIRFYYSELEGLYEKSEIEAMIEVAVEHYLGFTKTDLLSKTSSNINQSDVLKLYDCCKALKQFIPLQYILGTAWFYNLTFTVNASVLIPRPETEELVDTILKENKSPKRILDIGTGSGCIPITLKSKLPNAQVFGCDISKDALVLAEANAVKNKVSPTFFEADALNPNTFLTQFDEAFDLIVSNPPYIKESEKNALANNVIKHEPHLALFVEGEDAIIFYKRIVDACRLRLAQGGKLYFELNPITANLVKEYCTVSGLFSEVRVLKDMSGKFRFLVALKK